MKEEQGSNDDIQNGWPRLMGALSRSTQRWNRSLRFLAAGLPLLLLGIAILVAAALIDDEPWPYLLDARTGQIEVWPNGASTTVVPLNGATLCIRRSAASGLEIEEADGVCDGRWVAVSQGDHSEAFLEISEQSTKTHLAVTHERNGAFRILISSDEDKPIKLSGSNDLNVGHEALLVFAPESGQVFARTVIIPFEGRFAVGVGLDSLGLAREGLIRSGSVSVFGHSDDNASGRRALDEFQLLTGDRVEMSAKPDGREASSSGYFELKLVQPSPDQVPPGVRIVSTGFVEGLQVLRRGSTAINLEPSAWARLVRHSNITTWVTALLAIFGLMAVYREASELGTSHD